MKYILIVIFFLYVFPVHANEWEAHLEIKKLFENAHIQGTFVLYDVMKDQFIGYNQIRAKTRFVPASTFKIPHTLIGLSTGAVESVDDMLPYGGLPQPFKVWEKDMSLREAIIISNIAIYQELAKRIGLVAMQQAIIKMDYGNKNIGEHINHFWLEGPLKISALEQVQFLAKLAEKTLPFPSSYQKEVHEIILIEQSDNWKLYAKTGWENAPNSGIGWWVGWVEKDHHIYAFALNLDISKASDASKRIELGKACLKLLGIL